MAYHTSGPIASAEEIVDTSAVEQIWHFALGKRRRILIDRRYQLRVTFTSLLFVLALLVPLNVSYYYNLTADTEVLRTAPELRAFFVGQDRAQFFLVAVGSAIALAGVFLLSLLESHRTAGAAFALRRNLEKIEEGRFGTHVTLRKEDDLVTLEEAFNRMADSLGKRTREEIEELESIAGQVEQSASSPASRELLSRLRVAVERKRSLLG